MLRPRVAIIGCASSKHFRPLFDDELINPVFAADDSNQEAFLACDVIVSIAKDWTVFPRLSTAPFTIRCKWLHYSRDEDIDLASIYTCYFNNVTTPFFTVKGCTSSLDPPPFSNCCGSSKSRLVVSIDNGAVVPASLVWQLLRFFLRETLLENATFDLYHQYKKIGTVSSSSCQEKQGEIVAQTRIHLLEHFQQTHFSHLGFCLFKLTAVIVLNDDRESADLKKTIAAIQSQTCYLRDRTFAPVLARPFKAEHSEGKEELVLQIIRQLGPNVADFVAILLPGDVYHDVGDLFYATEAIISTSCSVILMSFFCRPFGNCYLNNLAAKDNFPLAPIQCRVYNVKKWCTPQTEVSIVPSLRTDVKIAAPLSCTLYQQLKMVNTQLFPTTAHISHTSEKLFIECQQPNQHLCIILPYRNRVNHLNKFVPIVSSFFGNLGLDVTIIVSEQTDADEFRKCILLNVAFLYAAEKLEKTRGITHYAMEDIDTYPVRFCNFFRPLPGVVNKLYGYDDCLGGCFTFNSDDFVKMDGFCNKFAGWGAEDGDAFRRALRAGLVVSACYQSSRHGPPQDCAFAEFDEPISAEGVRERLARPSHKRNMFIEKQNNTAGKKNDGLCLIKGLGPIDTLVTLEKSEDKLIWLKVDTNPIWEKSWSPE